MQHDFSVSVLVAFVITFSIDAHAQPLTIFVHNYADVGQRTLKRAETEAARILGTAGVQVNWVDCSNWPPALLICGESPDSTELVLDLLPASATLRGATSGALGFAVAPESGPFGSYAGVLYDRVESLRFGARANSVVLGDAMAHELGHLLLGAGSHAPSGIMKDEWHSEELKQAAQGTLVFHRKERHRMEENVRYRLATQSANPKR